MRQVPVQYSRSVKIEDLDPEVAKLPAVQAAVKSTLAVNPKAKEIVFGSAVGETMALEDTIAEAIKERGEAAVYENWARQTKTDEQNKRAADKATRATDPSKRKGGEAIRIDF